MGVGATSFINFNKYSMTNKNKNANQIILLSGKSVENIRDYKIQDNDTIYAINNKKPLEELTQEQGRNIDVWSLMNIADFKDMYHEVCEFLERDEDNRLVLWSEAIIENYHLVEAKPFPNPHKIIFVDHLIEYIYNYTNGTMNSLATLLSILTINKVPNIALFGCDGVESNDCKDIYLDQDKLSQDKMKRNNIYNDMMHFDKYIHPLLISLGGSSTPIMNINLYSHYQCFLNYTCNSITSTQGGRFILGTPNLSNSDISQIIINKQNLQNTSYLKRKRKAKFFKKLFF